MKKILFTLAGLFLFSIAFSQNLITVQNADTAKFYKSYTDAFSNAINGDTIYFPGGIYDINTLTIAKKLHIYGVGHYPDSTLATGITKFEGDIRFITGADSSLITGVYIDGNIYLGANSGNQEIHNFTVRRCRLRYLYLSYDGSTATPSSDIHIEENVITSSINGGYASDIYIERNIVESGGHNYFNGSGGVGNIFRNNIFLYDYSPFSSSTDNCNFTNNVFLTTYSSSWSSYLDGCVFTNNLFEYNFTFPSGTNTGSSNIVNQTQTTIFTNQTGNSFSYAHDYSIKIGSPGINGGDDGTDVGIFGTTTPYKAGAVPAHPHIREQSISTKTDGSGNINVSVKVSGQKK